MQRPSESALQVNANSRAGDEGAHQPIRLGEDRLRAIVETVVEAVITIDESGTIQFANQALLGMFGYAPNEVIGRNVRLLMPEPDHGKHNEYIQHYLESGNAKIIGIGREVVGRRKDGSDFPAELAVSETLIGDRHYFTGILRDITERKEAEGRLADHAKRLEAANDMLSEFAYAVSHDLKAPLRAVRNYADFLDQDLGKTLDAEHQDYLQGLLKATAEADDLIDDLLSYSEVSTGRPQVEETDLGALIDDILLGISIPEEVEITTADDWPTIVTAPTLVKQIVQNLVSNAVKFGPKTKKKVAIGWRKIDDAQLELLVEDNGIGIEPRFYEQIYEIFKRLHTRAEYEGTGIGLAIVKKAANRLGGTVRVESEPGKGSTFAVSLRPGDMEKFE